MKTAALGTIGLLIVIVGVAFVLCGCKSSDHKPPGMLMQVEKKEVKS